MEKIECTCIPWIAMPISDPNRLAMIRLNSFPSDEAIARDLVNAIYIRKRTLVSIPSFYPFDSSKQLPVFSIILSQFRQQNIQINSPP